MAFVLYSRPLGVLVECLHGQGRHARLQDLDMEKKETQWKQHNESLFGAIPSRSRLLSSRVWLITASTASARISTHRHASALNLTTSTRQNRGRGMKVQFHGMNIGRMVTGRLTPPRQSRVLTLRPIGKKYFIVLSRVDGWGELST